MNMGGLRVLCLMGSMLLVACGTTKLAMDRSDNVPAAQGQVKVKEKDGNRMVELKVDHLAPANRIDQNAQQYVVWVKPLEREGAAMNVGALALDDDLKGSLNTVTPFEKFEIFVTAEPSREAVNPTGQRVLWQRVD